MINDGIFPKPSEMLQSLVDVDELKRKQNADVLDRGMLIQHFCKTKGITSFHEHRPRVNNALKKQK